MARVARIVMVAGTGSHVGKSVLAAALCRLYARRGLRVAPFKAQNMALNSFVTPEGGEIGRAQAYQAEAAGIEPHVDMNPVLLKPNSQTGSQVIVLGRPVGQMSVREYHTYQREVWPVAMDALGRLRAKNDLVVVEGAGSIAEINLRDHDIVNLKVALHARAPVILVGDIDRGGVFASLFGTVELLEPAERDLVKALVINKFRGDPSLLDSGIRFLEERIGIPSLGVIPYLQDWTGDEEDSLGIADRYNTQQAAAPLRLVVVRFPYISNYTDFDALVKEDDVLVRYVTHPAELADAKAIILPGTKSTIADLSWLRERGLADAITREAAAGVPVVGICGGYQMLGKAIRDPENVESTADLSQGLGLLEVDTVFTGEKRTVRVTGELTGAGLGSGGTPVRGYEIHMGSSTRGAGIRPLLRLWEDGKEDPHEDGAVSNDGVVAGTYLHGLFDHPELRRCFLNRLREATGLAARAAGDGGGLKREADEKTAAIDRLCDHVASNIDLMLLHSIIGAES
ncbi:MAG: cobyric acid synthase [Thermoleophilia bacterium]|nr:cobyric acid synthase [Thermoleophilia bacterium]